MRLVLASGSPRRRDLLTLLGVPFSATDADVDETPHDRERPFDLVRRLAADKARSVDGDPVLAADTVVDVDGDVLGKPVDADDARRMLRRLSGRTHLVHTAVAVRSGEQVELEVVSTSVRFVPVSEEAIEWYVGTGEPFGKAGAYAIQGAGGALVDEVHGSVTNVMGLPLHVVVRILERRGIRVFPAGASLSRHSDGGRHSDG